MLPDGIRVPDVSRKCEHVLCSQGQAFMFWGPVERRTHAQKSLCDESRYLGKSSLSFEHCSEQRTRCVSITPIAAGTWHAQYYVEARRGKAYLNKADHNKTPPVSRNCFTGGAPCPKTLVYFYQFHRNTLTSSTAVNRNVPKYAPLASFVCLLFVLLVWSVGWLVGSFRPH